MRNYTIYFSIYGKKMKTSFFAWSEDQARQMVMNEITFHKIVAEKNQKDKLMDAIKGLWFG